MKHLKRIFSALLALVMTVTCFLSVTASAATAKTVRQYKKYVSLGDSIAAGFSMPEYNAYGEYVVPKKNIKGSYPNLLSVAVQATSTYGGKFTPLACPGFRTQEVRLMLDNSYEGDTITKNYVGELADASPSCGYDYETLLTWRSEFQTAVKNADLITLDIGLNDTWLPLSALALEWRDTGNSSIGVTKAIEESLEKYGTIGNVIATGMDLMVHLITMPQFVSYLLENISALTTGFKTNYQVIVDKIYELNPDVTLVHVGSYNSFKTWDDLPIIPELLDLLAYNSMNELKEKEAKNHDNAYYVDMSDIPLITNSLKDAIDTSTGGLTITYNPHPTAVGHQEMCDRILAVLPTGKRAAERTTSYPWLTKVDGTWAYRVNGKIQTSYTGFGESQYGIYYVKKGVVDFSVNGIVNVNGKKYYIKKNKLQSSYTGMISTSSTTYYVKNGMVQTSYSGIVTSNGKQYYISKGVWQSKYTGIVSGKSKSYYVKNGLVDTSFSGTVKSSSKTYTVKNGVVTGVK